MVTTEQATETTQPPAPVTVATVAVPPTPVKADPVLAATKPAPTAVAPAAAPKPAVKAAAKRVVKKPVVAAKPTVSATVKPTVAPKAKTVAKAPEKAPVKVTPKLAPKAAPKPAAKAPAKAAATTALKSKAVKDTKEKKPKLVRDSFTIPKAEYMVLDDLKQRAGKLASAVKKSELLRAGVKALAAMSDAAFLSALKAVPAIKTGRPSKTKD